LSETLAPFVVDHDAILMANHGVVAYGKDLLSAYLNMEIVEHFARIMLVARQLGRCQLLDDESVHELRKSRLKYQNAALHA
jgi:L-fuculose-phosphate aldolase